MKSDWIAAIIFGFLVDFLMLMGTNRLSGFSQTPGRCILGAAVGGVYTVVCLMSGQALLRGLPGRFAALGMIGCAAFGLGMGAVKRTGVFVLLRMALGGVAVTIGRGDIWGIVLGGALVWLLCSLGFGGQTGGQTYIPVTLGLGKQEVTVTALRDTGNLLRDPITGVPVIIVDGSVGETLTGLSRRQLAAPIQTLAERPIPGLRLIPYRCVGNHCGLLLGVKADRVVIGKQKQDAVVAFDTEGFGAGAVAKALAGGSL